MKILLATLALALVAGTASADTLWTYIGNATSDPFIQNFYPSSFQNPCACALDGAVTLASIVPSANYFDEHSVTPLAYSFTVNGFTFTQNNSTASFLFSFIDGQVALWHISGSTLGGQFFQSYSYDLFEATDSGPGMYEQGNRGTWTGGPVATPEPGTFALLGLGLLALASRGRKRAKVSSVWEPLA
jgi:PEP-CTERM motif